jgi:hypothetical protein
MAYTTTYGSADEPRVFKVEFAEKQRAPLKGEFFYVEGKVNAGHVIKYHIDFELIWI